MNDELKTSNDTWIFKVSEEGEFEFNPRFITALVTALLYEVDAQQKFWEELNKKDGDIF